MLVAAVDGGGSKTKAVIADETSTIIARAAAGCGNHQVCGLQESVANVALAVQTALNTLGKTTTDIDYTQFSLAGADRQADENLLYSPLNHLGFKHWGLTSDAWSSLRMGTHDGCGIGIVCGTGTNAIGVNAEGTKVQIGGFGYLFGDLAGGEALARSAFHTAVRSFEGRESASLLTELIPRYFGRVDMLDLIQYALDANWKTVPAGLAQTVHAAARQGDPIARSLLSEMGRELGKAAVAVYQRLRMWPTGVTVPIVLTGSIVQKGRNKDLLRNMLREVEPSVPQAEVRIPASDPVAGALLLALDTVGATPPPPIWKTVSADGL